MSEAANLPEKLAALAAWCNGPAWEKPIVVWRRKLLLRFIPYVARERLWVKDEGNYWRTMLSDNRGLVGADFQTPDGQRLDAYECPIPPGPPWRPVFNEDDATPIFERIEDAVMKAKRL